jgi:hypothetical protein
MCEAGSAQQGSMYASKWNTRSTRLSGKLRFSISSLVAVYVEATNGFDLERWMAALAHDAPVNVELQAYWEKPASSECAKRDIIGGRLTMNVAIVINHLGTSLWRPGWTVIAMSAAYLIRWRSPFMSAPEWIDLSADHSLQSIRYLRIDTSVATDVHR